MADKTDTIKSVYHDRIMGYGSVYSTWKEVKAKDNSITLQDVKDYINNLPQKQMKFKYKGYNSFTVNHFLDQIQLDLADFTQNASLNEGFRFCLIGVDVFSRYAWAVPKKQNDLMIS